MQRCTLARNRLTGTLLIALLTLAGHSTAHAAYIGPAPFTDNPDAFRALFQWTFPGAAADAAGPFVGPKNNWTVVSLDSPAPAGGPPTIRDFTVVAQHDPGAQPADAGHGPNARRGTMSLPNIARPSVGQPTRAAATRVEHDAHADYFATVVTVPGAGNLTVDIRGEHQGAPKAFVGSFKNFSAVNLTVTIIPSYRNADGSVKQGQPIGPFPVSAGGSLNRPIDPDPETGNAPTNYTVRAFGSAGSETTLAFLGTVDGIPGVTELELAPMTNLFLGDREFLVPMLRDVHALQDLFVFVDLLQWLAAGALFTPLDEFDIVNGMSDLLPGFFVSNSPILLGTDGIPTGDAFTGRAVALGGIDGSAPEPGVLLLVLTGASVALCRSRGRRAG